MMVNEGPEGRKSKAVLFPHGYKLGGNRRKE